MIYKWLVASGYDIIDGGEKEEKLCTITELSLTLGLRHPPGWYCVLMEAKGDIPQPQVLIQPKGQVVIWLCRQRDSPLSLVQVSARGSSCCPRSLVPQVGWLFSPVPLQVGLLKVFVDVVGLTFPSFFSRMFQCGKCESATSDKEKDAQHYLQEYLKPSQVPHVWVQFRFRACAGVPW